MKTRVMAIASGEEFEAMMAAAGVTSGDVECSDDDTTIPDTFNFIFNIEADKIEIAELYLRNLLEI